MALLKIVNGTVYDPANGIDGVVRDVWIQDGQDRRAADTRKAPGIPLRTTRSKTCARALELIR